MSDDIIKEGLAGEQVMSTKPALVEARNNGTPEWLTEARKWIGQKEIPGKQSSSWIVSMCAFLGLPWREDETPWCGTFVGWVMKKCGFTIPAAPARARSWERFGVEIDKPVPGCVVVFWRGSRKSGSGHVGFVTGVTKLGYLIVLGGNQGDMVCEKTFLPKNHPDTRVLSYRWPLGVPVPEAGLKIGWDVKLSTKED